MTFELAYPESEALRLRPGTWNRRPGARSAALWRSGIAVGGARTGSAHRRGGYRDPESQAFIESWFSKLKERLIWREEFETLDQARQAIGAYVERYHYRPHQFLAYRTPKEVRQIWEDAQETEALRNQAA